MSLTKEIDEVTGYYNSDIAARSEQGRIDLKEKISCVFKKHQGLYLERIKGHFTNWNAGIRKNGREKHLILDSIGKVQ